MRVCTICQHPQRLEMERGLLDGLSFRDIAGRFSVSRSALERHKSEHLPARMLRAKEAREARAAGSLVERLRELQAEASAVLTSARDANDPGLVLRALSRLERQLELEGRLVGELVERAPAVNVLIAPEWVALRAAVMEALAPFPDARAAVSRAIVEASGRVHAKLEEEHERGSEDGRVQE